MSWDRELSTDGLPFCVYAGGFFTETKGSIAGFFIDDPATIQAIKDRDSRVFQILDWIISDDARDFCEAQWVNNGDWRYYGAEKDSGYEGKLRRYLANRHVSTTQKTLISLELANLARKAAKKHHTKRRRTEFQEQRDRLALALIERDGYTCAECGAFENLTIDHIVPVSKGGSDDLDNLRFLCRGCNSKKGDRSGA